MTNQIADGQELPPCQTGVPLVLSHSIPVHQPRKSRGETLRIDRLAQPASHADPHHVAQHIADVRRHLEICIESLRTFEAAASAAAQEGREAAIGVSPVTIQLVTACLAELLKLEWEQPHREYCPDLCKLLDCPQQPVLRHAIYHTIQVLEKTKLRFKSKELKALRENLEVFLTNSDRVRFTPENLS